jgi:hypothetical protein
MIDTLARGSVCPDHVTGDWTWNHDEVCCPGSEQPPGTRVGVLARELPRLPFDGTFEGLTIEEWRRRA